MNGPLAGKVALVVGATGGIGEATAHALAAAGASVAIAGRRRDEAERVAAALRDAGTAVLAQATDIADDASVDGLFAALKARFGRLDVAVNNAGIEGTLGVPTHLQDPAGFDRVMAVNLRGTFCCLRLELELMLAGGGGAIVNVSSILGQVGFAGSAPYVASKHALIGLTRSAALEYAKHGIRVNAICPGGVETAMMDRLTAALGTPAEIRAGLAALHPMGRLATPAEIAANIVHLCSPAATFVTGQALAVDGGFLAQ